MRRIPLHAVFVAMTLVGFGAVTGGCTKIEARDLIREGNHLYSEADYEGAIAKYDESLELEPEGVTVLWNRACAAESIVLRLKDVLEGEDFEKRHKYAERALSDFDAWISGLEAPTEEDRKLVQEHRLAVLSADNRCDDLVAHWMEKVQQNPNDEGLYAVIARTYEDTCGQPEKADEWFVKRTKDFPDSAKAWYALAVRRFEPLFPDMDAQLPYNPAVDATSRMQMADEVISLLRKASQIDQNYRDPYVWRSMAYNQRMFARQYVDPPEEPEDKLEAILAREDSMLAWRETQAVCDIDSIPACPTDVHPTVLFENPGEFASNEVILAGKIVPESLKGEGLTWEFQISVDMTPPVPEGELPPDKPDKPEEGPAPKLVTVKYQFMQPEAPEGEAPVDVGPHIEEMTTMWKEGNKTSFNGQISASGDVLSVTEKPLAGCCPAAPLSPAEEAADQARKAELQQQIADKAAAAAEASQGKKGKKGKKGGRR